MRERDTRAGTVELAIPKLRSGSYYPDRLLERRRAEHALISVVATSYLLGVSTRKVRESGRTINVHALVATAVNARSSAWRSLLPRTVPAGRRSCAVWWAVVCPVFSW